MLTRNKIIKAAAKRGYYPPLTLAAFSAIQDELRNMGITLKYEDFQNLIVDRTWICNKCGKKQNGKPKDMCQACVDKEEHHIKAVSVDKPCKSCEVMMVGVHYLKKYCDECADKRVKQRNKESSREYWRKHKKKRTV